MEKHSSVFPLYLFVGLSVLLRCFCITFLFDIPTSSMYTSSRRSRGGVVLCHMPLLASKSIRIRISARCIINLVCTSDFFSWVYLDVDSKFRFQLTCFHSWYITFAMISSCTPCLLSRGGVVIYLFISALCLLNVTSVVVCLCMIEIILGFLSIFCVLLLITAFWSLYHVLDDSLVLFL